jgi:hypothetical protein
VTVLGRTPVTVASESQHSGPWYKHRGVLVAAGLAAVMAVAVVTDLPQHASRPVEIAGDKSVMSQVNADVGPCSYALGEAFTIYGDLTAHTLSASDAARVPALLRDDQEACSFVDDSVYQLSTIEVPGSAVGKDLGQLVSSVTLWASSDALSAIEQIQILYSHPSNATALQRLAQDEQLLGRDRGQAEAELDAADTVLRTRLPALRLAQVPASSQPSNG